MLNKIENSHDQLRGAVIVKPIKNFIDDMINNEIYSRTIVIKKQTLLKKFLKDIKPAVENKLVNVRTNPINKNEITITLGPKSLNKI